MVYKLFLYKTAGYSKEAPCIYLTNRTLNSFSISEWERNETEKHMKHFNACRVKKEIEKVLCSSEVPLCKVYANTGPKQHKEFICVVTSFDKIKYVINTVYTIATKNGLILYDSQKDQTFYYKDLYDVDFVNINLRAQAISRKIFAEMNNVFHIRKLGFFDGDGMKLVDYAVTLRKIKGISFENRIEEFYQILKASLVENETLETYDKCFAVCSMHYRISFSLEAYKKNADRIGYISDGAPCTETIKRMSCEVAWSWAKENLEYTPEQYGYCMYKSEMVNAFPNPVERFVKGISILKEARKEPQIFSYNDYYGVGEIYIKIVAPEYGNYNPEEISYLRISEDVALPLLQIISEFYPYIWDRYYESNHLSAQMMLDIVEKTKRVRNLIVYDTNSEELEPYAESIRGSVKYLLEYDEWESIDKDYCAFLYQHRYKAVRIFDIFIKWIENQIETYGENYLHFNIEGP